MTRAKKILIFILIIFGLSLCNIFGQSPHKKLKKPALKNWEINLNGGVFSYFGDISGFDNNFIEKLNQESNFASGLIISKNISQEIKLSGQIIFGKLKGRNNNQSISSEVFEYNFHVRFDVLKIANVKKLSKWRFDLYGGLGNFLFNTTRYEYIEGETKEYNTKARVPEFLYLMGTSLSYDIFEKMAISVDFSLRQCQNDKIDNLVANNDFDYYSYLNIGITYKIFRLNKDLDSRAKYSHYSGNGKSVYRNY
ncbi:MAG: hypothetical protein R2750_13940 [Bacteroidales bacterium]